MAVRLKADKRTCGSGDHAVLLAKFLSPVYRIPLIIRLFGKLQHATVVSNIQLCWHCQQTKIKHILLESAQAAVLTNERTN